MKNYFKIFIALTGSLTFLSTASAQEFSKEGAQIFTDYCEACHQPGGVGFEDVYPALKGNAFVLGDKEEVIYLLLEGRAGMPTFIGDLEPEQIKTIINFIRNSWGNHAEEVTQKEVDDAFDLIAEEDDGFGPGN